MNKSDLTRLSNLLIRYKDDYGDSKCTDLIIEEIQQRYPKSLSSLEISKDFEIFWKSFPHARKGKKRESYDHYRKHDPKEVTMGRELLLHEIKLGLRELKYVPACERWLRDFVYNDVSTRARLVDVVEQMILQGSSMEDKKSLDAVFHDYGIRDMFREYRKRKNNNLQQSIINAK